jgi:hypothetical protein
MLEKAESEGAKREKLAFRSFAIEILFKDSQN